jgi:hypothetical protein
MASSVSKGETQKIDRVPKIDKIAKWKLSTVCLKLFVRAKQMPFVKFSKNNLGSGKIPSHIVIRRDKVEDITVSHFSISC